MKAIIVIYVILVATFPFGMKWLVKTGVQLLDKLFKDKEED